ncbi:hypothetical protein WJX73_010769 [Symbiochloris irregularis]|uniref:Exocyst complex component Sec10 n=1 Tax=Symbiochloris irregularis TaxID=706552 RepID=A0AAW1P138_9CHLO
MSVEKHQEPWVTLSSFEGDFTVASLLNRVVDGVIEPHTRRQLSRSKYWSSTPRNELDDTRALLQQLLEQFERADGELEEMRQQVDEDVQVAQEKVQAEEETFQVQVEVLEGSMDETQANFQELNAQMSQISQTFARIGDHLESSESKRKRSVEAAAVVQYLQLFANWSRDFQQLPQLFRSEDRLPEAAAMCRKLVGVGNELLRGREEADEQAGGALPEGSADFQGSMEHAVAQLQHYMSKYIVELVILRFDMALDGKDTADMAACSSIMMSMQGNCTELVRRYRSKVRLKDYNPGAGPVPPGDAQAGKAALASLGDLCKRFQTKVAEHEPIIRAVFPDPGAALAMLVEFLFEESGIEEKVNGMMPRQLTGASAEVLQQYLKLGAEAYKRVLALAAVLQEVVRKAGKSHGTADADRVQLCVNEAFGHALEQHLDQELTWLRQAHDVRAAKMQDLSLELVQQAMEAHTEAAERCRVLYAGELQAEHICTLFCSRSQDVADLPGCLLQQVTSHVANALSAAVRHCESSCLNPFTAAGLSSRQAIQGAAAKVVEDSVGRVLSSVALMAKAARLLQQHHARSVAPLLQGALSVTAATGLASALDRMQGLALSAIRSTLEAFFHQVDTTLMTLQQANDFKPLNDALEMGPTVACSRVLPLLDAMCKCSATHLQGANADSFNSEVGRRTGLLLTAHMQRWAFSRTGAIRWTQDVGTYREAVREFGAGAASQARLDRLAMLANVLNVPVESLVMIVENELRLTHRQALPYIRLRSDFKTARVDGVSLEKLFSGD